jgi:methylenetetrahydrofolate reductase (NADPH)
VAIAGPVQTWSTFAHASDLIAHLRKTAPSLCIGAACYPEGHVESASLDESMRALRIKQEAGADFLVSQLFFDNDDFYRFREQCLRYRIKLPVVAGIMPFTSVKQIQRMAFNCGASIPAKVVKRLVRAGDDPPPRPVRVSSTPASRSATLPETALTASTSTA